MITPKHTIGILVLRSRSKRFKDEFYACVDGVVIKGTSVLVWPVFEQGPRFRLTFQNKAIRQHPEYRELKSQIEKRLEKWHQSGETGAEEFVKMCESSEYPITRLAAGLAE